MPSGWSNDYTGPNSFYTSIYDDRWGWREPGPPPSVIPTMPLPCLGLHGCCRKIGNEFVRTACDHPVDPEDLEHVTCLMDEQLNLIEQYFLANGMGQSDALAIKDEAKNFLEATAVNDGSNPDLLNWFYPGGVLNDIYQALGSIYPQVTPSSAGEFAQSLAMEPQYFTLVTQLQLMSDIGEPSNKDSVDKDQFKSIDWNSIIPSGTTISSFDSASVLSAAENEIISAGGTPPAGLADSISRTGIEAQSLFTTTTIPFSPTTHIDGHFTTPTFHPGTPQPTPSTTSAPPSTTTKSTTVKSDPTPTQSSSLPTVTQIATQTVAVSGSGGANSNGFGNDITNGNGITNSNGLGSMFGDPHIRIKNPNEPAICFDIEGQFRRSFYNPQMIDHSLQECIWIFSIF